jgi:hypothetical protein
MRTREPYATPAAGLCRLEEGEFVLTRVAGARIAPAVMRGLHPRSPLRPCRGAALARALAPRNPPASREHHTRRTRDRAGALAFLP